MPDPNPNFAKATSYARLNRLDTVLGKDERFKPFLEPKNVEVTNSRDGSQHHFSQKIIDLAVHVFDMKLEASSLKASDVFKIGSKFLLNDDWKEPEDKAEPKTSPESNSQPGAASVEKHGSDTGDFRIAIYSVAMSLRSLCNSDTGPGAKERREKADEFVELCKKNLPALHQ